MTMRDVMLDIETTGTRPDRHAIIQIAAVRFDLDTGEVSPDLFNRCLRPMPHRGWCLDTRRWWARQGQVLASIEARMEDPAPVLSDLQRWVGPAGDRPVRLWAKPTHFEHPFLESHFLDAGVVNPFHYRFARDLNTWLEARLGEGGAAAASKAVPMTGPAHDALHDALHQLQVLLSAS